jgi:pimeloyl-ACP methyl ester carboxylesterase
MSIMRTLARHLSVGLLGFTTWLGPAQAAQAPDPNATSRFFVTFRGVRIGSEVVTVARAQGTITISSRGQVAPPIDLITTKFEMTYGTDWQPRQLTIEGALRNQTLAVATSFGLTTATNDVVQGERRGSITHEVSPRAVVLPPSYFGAYEALAARLPSFQPGSRFPVYIAPEGEISATLNRITPRRVVSPEAAIDLTEYDLTLNRPGVPMSVVVWADSRNRLAKVVFGDQGYAAIREDLSTSRSREERIRNPGDSSVYIPASGFSIAATVTTPKTASGRLPAVVLVGGQGRQDRDEMKYGVPIFGQLAGQLADAGFLVVRFDKRGVGQSGGRPEHAGVVEYAEDLVDIVDWLRRRKDVDQNRISVVSHADGSAIALTAAGLEKKIGRIALLSAPGLTGRDTVLAQQQLVLEKLTGSPAEREARVALQERVINAVITGKGWELVPPDVRQQADSVWFRSWLLFDPAVAMRKVGQPVLIVHGALDREMAVSNADHLQEIAAARRKPPASATVKVVVPGVNHLLLPATTGEIDEYDSLPGAIVSPAVVAVLVNWLNQTVK